MKNANVLIPLFEPLDKVLLVTEEINDIEKTSGYMECDNDEEFDVQRSIN